MHKLLAQSSTSLGTIGGTDGLGPFGNLGKTVGSGAAGGVTALQKVTGAVSAIIGFMTIGGAIWFLFQILYGGYEWMSSGGDSKKVGAARDQITHAFIGLVVVVGAWAILATAGQFLNFDITISNPAKMIQQLQLNGTGGTSGPSVQFNANQPHDQAAPGLGGQ